jgi:CheY-like chemotaxis protein
MYRHKKVMVIDDSHIDRFIAERIISKSNFSEHTILMSSAIDALKYLSSLENQDDLPQVIFLDIRMPEMDGFEFLKRYSDLPDQLKRNCIIAMISSSADINDHKRAKESPYVYCFMEKPLSNEQLSKNLIHNN